MASQPSYVTFKGVDSYQDSQLMTELENNLKYFLDWGFLSIGAWTNVITGSSGNMGGYGSKLNWVKDGSTTTGQIWQGIRKDWVWETGVNYGTGNLNPLNPITGVFISGSLVNSNSYYINYPYGRVVFNFPVATGADVRVNHSYRNVQVYKADEAPWWRELQFNTFDATNPLFTQDPRTGDWSIGAYKRIQLPCIIIEAVPRGTSKGYEIGNGSLWVEQDVLFHILADNRTTRNNLTSILQVQNDKVIWLFDSNVITSGRHFPLNYLGSRTNHLVYPDLVSETGFRWKKCTFTKTNVSEIQSVNSNLFEGVVRSTLELVFDNI